MQKGCNTIIYRAADFAEGRIITAYFYDPNMVRSSLLTFEEDSFGLYHIRYCFGTIGKYTVIVFEDGIPKKSIFFFIAM